MNETIYILIGYKNYEIRNKKLFRKPHKVKHSRFKWQYFTEREIKITTKDNQKGYFLNGKFHSLKALRHRLKLIVDFDK